MQREEQERMLRMVTWLTQLEWQMDSPLLMEWRRLKAQWYRETLRRKKPASLHSSKASQAQPKAAESPSAAPLAECRLG